MAVGADEVGKHLGVTGVGLRSRDGMAIPIARRRQRVDREDLVTGTKKCRDDEPSIDLDADNNRSFVLGMLGDEIVQLPIPVTESGTLRFPSTRPSSDITQTS